MLDSVLVGFLLAMLTICVHAIGTVWLIWRLKKITPPPQETSDFIRFAIQLRVLCTTAVTLLTFHLIEVILWAVAYITVIGDQKLDTFEEAIYFSTVTFASLGYGDVVIGGSWRLLSAIQAMTGLLAFGWSSALLFVLVQRILTDSDNDKI